MIDIILRPFFDPKDFLDFAYIIVRMQFWKRNDAFFIISEVEKHMRDSPFQAFINYLKLFDLLVFMVLLLFLLLLIEVLYQVPWKLILEVHAIAFFYFNAFLIYFGIA